MEKKRSMNEIWKDITNRFKRGDILIRLIYVNAGVFIISVLFSIAWGLVTGNNYESASGIFAWWFALPTNNLESFVFKPYTLITSIFLHIEFFHLFWNMILLYFLGRIFLNYFNQKQLFGLYVLGGLIGGLVLLVITNISPYFKSPNIAFGASAGVMAIVIAIVSYTPKTSVTLFGIFPIKILWIGLFFVFSDVFYFYDSNTGGHLAHLAGAAVGYWFSSAFKQGKDITQKINKYILKIQHILSRKTKMKVVYNQDKVRKMSDADYNSSEKVSQAEIDTILDKISASGYSSLTKKEKDILFQYSNKNK
ncbi:MAG: rhomboid family intramembrane serine protease [Flavobacteriales bacterium]|nr:rhomboid family intramembrane serine protease [Flavobacteriales bacterium]|tara:strand:- start:1950 stop:2873 length:924 start_codon:yes stop_codon:yes gene_type:complete